MLHPYASRDGQVALRDHAQDGTGEFRYVWGCVGRSRGAGQWPSRTAVRGT
jgi:hypothetical protein